MRESFRNHFSSIRDIGPGVNPSESALQVSERVAVTWQSRSHYAIYPAWQLVYILLVVPIAEAWHIVYWRAYRDVYYIE